MRAALSQKDEMALVQPWLGADALVSDLPLPQLIDASISPAHKWMSPRSPRVSRRRHPMPCSTITRHWIARLKSLADTVIWSAYGILLLIAVATAAAVTFATRAGLASAS